MRIAVIDDDIRETDNMQQILNSFAKVSGLPISIDIFGSAEDFLAAFSADYYDVLFMDIYMKEMTGIDAANEVRKTDNKVVLIFLTSSTDHMPDAFSCHAFEYIVKPASDQRLYEIMQDVIRILPAAARYLEFVCDRKSIRILLTDLVSVSSDNHMLEIADQYDNIYHTRISFSDICRMIDSDDRFLSLNKGILVNMDFIAGFGNACCTMQGGREFPVKVRDRLKIEQSWQNYCFDKIRSGQKFHKGDGE